MSATTVDQVRIAALYASFENQIKLYGLLFDGLTVPNQTGYKVFDMWWLLAERQANCTANLHRLQPVANAAPFTGCQSV